jgi:alpha-D-ribose 1-methylphosphonate 5-triphosphate synthase subunit PhnG
MTAMSDEKRGARVKAAVKRCPGKGLLTVRGVVCATAGLAVAGAVTWAAVKLAARRAG